MADTSVAEKLHGNGVVRPCCAKAQSLDSRTSARRQFPRPPSRDPSPRTSAYVVYRRQRSSGAQTRPTSSSLKQSHKEGRFAAGAFVRSRSRGHGAWQEAVIRLFNGPRALRTAHSSFSAAFTSLPLNIVVGQPFVLLALNIPSYPM